MNPNTHKVDVVFLESLELSDPVVVIKVATNKIYCKVALLLPRMIDSIEENFFAIPVKLVAADCDVQWAPGL